MPIEPFCFIHLATTSFRMIDNQDGAVQQPAEYGYEVYPLHLQDDVAMSKAVFSWLMRFNDVLDGDKLRNSLLRLLERGDWRKLGGRLHRKVRLPYYGSMACCV